MIIRCPYCEFTRTMHPDKIPPTAEVATCPKCKQRFRFRTLPSKIDTQTKTDPRIAEISAPKAFPADRAGLMSYEPQKYQTTLKTPETIPTKPSEEDIKDSSPSVTTLLPPIDPANHLTSTEEPEHTPMAIIEGGDIWEAMDALHDRWQQEAPHLSNAEQEPISPIAASAIPANPSQHVYKPAISTAHSLQNKIENKQADPEPDILQHRRQIIADHKAMQAGGSSLHKTAIENQSTPEIDNEDTNLPVTIPLEHIKEVEPTSDVDEVQLVQDEVMPEADIETITSETINITDKAEAINQNIEPDTTNKAASNDSALNEATPAGMATFPFELSKTEPNDERASEEEAIQEPNADMLVLAWEEPKRLGWLRSFVQTIYSVMFNASGVFSYAKLFGSLVPSYLFFIIIGYTIICGSVIGNNFAKMLLPYLQETLPLTQDIPILLFTAPLVLGLILLLVSGCLRVTALFATTEDTDFSLCFALTSYSSAPLILCIVPLVGPIVGGLWFIFTFMLACREALYLSKFQSFLVSMPAALLLLGAMAWFYYL